MPSFHTQRHSYMDNAKEHSTARRADRNLYVNTRSLGALRAPTSRLRPFGPALGPSGLLDNVLHALRALRPCDPRNSAISPKIRNFPENPKFPRKSKISHPNTILMMMMTIWWSKATRLLEFNRSSVNRTLGSKNVTPFA